MTGLASRRMQTNSIPCHEKAGKIFFFLEKLEIIDGNSRTNKTRFPYFVPAQVGFFPAYINISFHPLTILYIRCLYVHYKVYWSPMLFIL